MSADTSDSRLVVQRYLLRPFSINSMTLKSLSINKKLLLSFFCLALCSAGGGFISWYLLDSVRQYQATKSNMNQLVTLVQEAQQAEKSFLLYDQIAPSYYETSTSDNLVTYHEKIVLASKKLKELQQDELVTQLGLSGQLTLLERELNAYEHHFSRLHAAVSQRGFKDWGLIGEMRSYVHVLLEAVSPEEQVFALSLRRHEKDYLLRKDPKYVDRLNETVEAYKQFLLQATGGHFTKRYQTEAILGIEAYQQHFARIVAIEEQIGKDQNSGMQRDLTESVEAILPVLTHVDEVINTAVDTIYPQSLLVLILSVIFLLSVGILLSYLLTKHLGSPIIRLDAVVNRVLSGDMEVASQIQASNRRDEIGSLVNHFREMMQQLQKSIYEANFKNEKLEQASRDEAARRWLTEGVSTIADELKHQGRPLNDLAYGVISALVRYVGAAQACIYIKGSGEGEEMMNLSACYAANRRKYREGAVYKGEGLIGAAWIENDELFLTEIPQGYLTIQTGLGHIDPQCIFLVPVRSDQGVEAVIELASLQVLSVTERKLVWEVADRLGGVISAVRLQNDSKHLLQETQRMAEELKTNEEELRQNMEELTATQEETLRRHQELVAQLNSQRTTLGIVKDVIAKFFKGMIIADEHRSILHVNDYASFRLRQNEQELLGKNINGFFEEDQEAILKKVINDPSYLLHGFTEPHKLHLQDAYGLTIPIMALMTSVMVQNQTYHVYMFNKYSRDLIKRTLRDARGRQLLSHARGQG